MALARRWLSSGYFGRYGARIMPLEVNEIGIVMRVVDGPDRPVQLKEGDERSEERREELIDECVRRVLEALEEGAGAVDGAREDDHRGLQGPEIPEPETAALQVLINPEEYTHKYSIVHNDANAPGASGTSQEFNRMGPETVSFTIWFDRSGVVPGFPRYSETTSLAQQIKLFKELVFTYQGETHSPSYLMLTWGTLVFRCRLTSLDLTYTMFRPDGDSDPGEVPGVLPVVYGSQRARRERPESVRRRVSSGQCQGRGHAAAPLPSGVWHERPLCGGRARQRAGRLSQAAAGHAAALPAAGNAGAMSAPSPNAAVGLLSIEIKSGGKAIDDSFEVVSIDTWNAVNKVPKARITLIDGSVADATFEISSLDTFLPGKAIEIAAGYDGTLETIFSGIVIGHRIEIPRNAASRLVVDVADKAIKMTVSRNTAALESISDADLISQLISAAGLSKDVADTSATHEAVVQYHATDWDMMLMRAEMNGMVVTVDAGKVTVKAPDTSQAPVLEVTYGESMLDLCAELDALRQLPQSAIKGYAWDRGTQQLLESGAGRR